MTNEEMFEKSFERPRDYFQRHPESQWNIDADLGILDWDGSHMTPDDHERFRAHYA